MKIQRIIVPTDFSPQSRIALRYAIDLAKPWDAELLLVHVVEPIRYTRFLEDVSELLEKQGEEAAEDLSNLEKEIRQSYRNCRGEVHFGVAFEVIADVAEKSGADLIVVATHGHTGFSRLFLGSVAERLVRLARCPVLTVHAEEPSTPARPRRAAARSRARVKRSR